MSEKAQASSNQFHFQTNKTTEHVFCQMNHLPDPKMIKAPYDIINLNGGYATDSLSQELGTTCILKVHKGPFPIRLKSTLPLNLFNNRCRIQNIKRTKIVKVKKILFQITRVSRSPNE